MTPDTFPLKSFRVLYPQFDAVPDDEIFIISQSALNYFSSCRGVCTDELWMLVAAHMLQLRQWIAQGESPTGVVTAATIGSVNVSFTAPPVGSNTSHWFNLPPFGQQYLALLNRCGRAPFYVGGGGERSAFRGVRGRFPNRGRILR
ncbi:DUF4054 domain-containing protein [Xenorhabdus bovienii]|uniref:DUF4054 domain-containing protein n=1 Tax=Xenorhabdus bovienii TaxID=40576 RepID=UPI00237CB83B|nr:DUF4054 domain-containing protein [Xenorhabdus bovienii]MDE1483407.1 DUF4054 domain-containing protein [Xenorhabdus bovienii]MDE9442488.1 DUF4054 domain-containing protein [Xenorhabdus bovienii]